MGAIAVNATEAQLDALSRYGMALGMAFQITDDLLDAGQDAHSHDASTPQALSCLAVYDTETAKHKAHEQIDEALSAVETLEDKGRVPLQAIVSSLIDRTE
jgi:geranylgeranyl pyrophosphate synthase